MNEDSVPQDIFSLEVWREVAEDRSVSLTDMNDFILGDVEPDDLGDRLWVARPSRELVRRKVRLGC